MWVSVHVDVCVYEGVRAGVRVSVWLGMHVDVCVGVWVGLDVVCVCERERERYHQLRSTQKFGNDEKLKIIL